MRTIVLGVVLLLGAATGMAASDYAEINGVRVYYEVHGQGRPTVLLHGGSSSIARSFANQVGEYSKTRQVIAPERRGHGHTADKDAPFSYDDMTSETATLLRRLAVTNADVVGFSDGGIVALMLAIRHPELVRRVVASGANYHPEGLTKGSRDWLRATKPEDWRDANRAYYEATSPDGAARWPVFAGKLMRLWLEAPTRDELNLEMIGKVEKPVLIIAGDRDVTTLEHTVEIYRALRRGQLFVVPGTPHDTFELRPEWMNAVVLSFLDAEEKGPAR